MAAVSYSYYEATAERGAARPPLQGPADARVAIVGAGYAGLATALGLVERGVDGVVLLEAARVAEGASGRNGGFVFGGYSLDGESLAASVGLAEARALYGRTLQAVALIRRRVDAFGIACDVVDGGALLVNWFDDDTVLQREQRRMREVFGIEWPALDRATLQRDHVRSSRYYGALAEPGGFHFHPLKYALGIARAFEAKGGRLHEGAAARAIRRDGAGWVVECDGGRLRAEQVVVTGGGTLRGVVPALERAMLPIATYVMATEPLGERLEAWLPSRAAIYDTRFAFDYYRALPDTRLLWGGRISVRQRAPRDIARFLHADMVRVFPAFADARVEYAWGGLMSYARHRMPQIGRLVAGPHAGVWHGLGFGGHGVAPTTVAGEVLADALSGRAPIPSGFAAFGLPRTWGLLGRLAAQASYSWAAQRDAWRDR